MAKEKEEKTKEDFEGHRKRLRERFDRTGFEGFAHHEILELILFYSRPRVDTKPISKALLARFKELPKIFQARIEELSEVEGIGPESVRLFHIIRDLSHLFLKAKINNKSPQISSASDLVTYLKATMANLPEEEFRVVFVNHANRVLKDETISKGTEDQTAVYPRKVMKRALALHATGILVAHNHPTGNLNPSNADREITRALVSAAATLEIRFLDHIILGQEGEGYFSFRENNLIV